MQINKHFTESVKQPRLKREVRPWEAYKEKGEKEKNKKSKREIAILKKSEGHSSALFLCFPMRKVGCTVTTALCVQGGLLVSNNLNIIITWQNTQNQKMQIKSTSPCVSLCGGRLTTGGDGHSERDGKWEKMAVVPQSMGSLLCGPMGVGCRTPAQFSDYLRHGCRGRQRGQMTSVQQKESSVWLEVSVLLNKSSWWPLFGEVYCNVNSKPQSVQARAKPKPGH